MDNIYNNKVSFINIKPRKLINIIVLFIMLFLLTLTFIAFTEIYDNYQTKGYITCNDTCILTTYIPSTIVYDTIKFNNKNYDYNVIKEEITIDEETITSLKKLEIKVNHKFLDQEIINLNFYYNKQRIYIKLKEKMF